MTTLEEPMQDASQQTVDATGSLPRPVPRTSRARASVPKRRRKGRLRSSLRTDRVETPAVFTSTRQAEALNPALIDTHRPLAGPPMGYDTESGTSMTGSGHELYEQGRITSPVVLIAGAIGVGKSTLVKCHYCARPVAEGAQVAVFDRKDQEGRGEYHDTARICDGSVFEFSRAKRAGINLMDPNIVRQGEVNEETGEVEQVGQDHLLLLAAEYAHGKLTSRERWALRAAHKAALDSADSAGRVATIRDVIEALFRPVESAAPRQHLLDEGIVTVKDLTMWGLDLAMDLQRFVDGDLAGLIDGETSKDQDWNANLLIFDTSDIPENSPALSLVMALVATFLSSVWSRAKGRRRILVVEEGYSTVGLQGPGTISVAGILRGLVKRGRGIGLLFVTVVHHISDVPKDSDAMSLLREAQVVHMFRQDREDDRNEAVRWFGLPSWSESALLDLDKGEQIWMISNEPPHRVQGFVTDIEAGFTDTDAAMRGADPRTDDEGQSS